MVVNSGENGFAKLGTRKQFSVNSKTEGNSVCHICFTILLIDVKTHRVFTSLYAS